MTPQTAHLLHISVYTIISNTQIKLIKVAHLYNFFWVALCRSPLHTAFFSPYVADAPYGLFFALCRSPLHTGFFSPYVARRSIRAFSPYVARRSIRAFFRPMSLAAPYGLLASAIAQWAIRLRGCAIARWAIRAAFVVVRHLCLIHFRGNGG